MGESRTPLIRKREGEEKSVSRAVPQKERPVRGELITIDEAVKYIRMGKTTFYECINDCSIPFFRPPRGKILLDTADLDDWLRKSKVSAGAVPGNI